jgi:hypothetical protein
MQPPHAYMFWVEGQLYIYVQEMEGYYIYIYIYIFFFLIKAAHTVLGWNWDWSLSVQNAKLANFCNANRYCEPVLKKLLVQVLS